MHAALRSHVYFASEVFDGELRRFAAEYMYGVFSATIVTLRLFLFISEPKESDHDYQPVGGTGKFLNINFLISHRRC
jgi:hypothetical protein